MLRLCVVLLPALLVAAGNLSPVTVLPQDGAEPGGAAPAVGRLRPGGAPFRVDIGVVDTIGGTTYDWQANGPIWRMLVNSPGYGVHATWMHSESDQSTFPDRNMRYNFFDELTEAWNWIDPDYMWSGVNTFTSRAGYGSIDADPTDGVAIVSCHYTASGGVTPKVARDAAAGAGIFEYADGWQVLGACQWPPISVSEDGTIDIFPITTSYELSYSRIAAGYWPTFSTPVTGIEPSPGFPTHSIAASKQSGRVCLAWEISTDDPQDAYIQTSTDYGVTWTDPEQLLPPTAFGSDTVTTFHITSLFPYYDSDDRLNIAANVCPEVNDTVYIIPSQIWLYCPDNSPQWNRVHIAACAPENLQAAVGYNATYACRPSVGEDDDGDLFVVWEQFDSANVEPITSRLRADIWAAGSTDGGINWSTALKLTTAGTASCRFPSICDLAWSSDSIAVVYEVDQCAGFFVQAEGPVTDNPIVVQKVPIDSIVQRGPYAGRVLSPNRGEVIAGGSTFEIAWTVSPKDFAQGVLYLSTDGGATFPTAIDSAIPPADTTCLWDPVPSISCSRCRVKFAALDSLGATVFSDRSDADFTIDSDSPPAPVKVLPRPDTAVNNRSVVFCWLAAPDTGGISHYRLQLAYDSLFAWLVDTTSSADTTRTRTLAVDSVYYWRLMACDRAGHESPWTSSGRFEVDAQAPGVPTLLEPVGGAWLRSPDVVFRWTAVQFGDKDRPTKLGLLAPVRYILSVDTAATGIDLWVDTLSVTTDTLTMPWQRRYWWQVRAFDLAGNRGAVTSASSFGVDTTRPPMATLVYPPDSGVIHTDTTSIIWRRVRDSVGSVSHYDLQLAPDTMFTETLLVTDTMRLETLPGEAEYYWRARAVDSAGNVGRWSPRRTFTYRVVGVAENRLDLGTEVRLHRPAPNPFARTTVARLVLPGDMPVTADVYNAAGQRVRSLMSGLGHAGMHRLAWDGTDAAARRVQAGVYYLRVTTGNDTVTQAVVLSR